MSTDAPWYRTKAGRRVATLAFPPLGLVLLWRWAQAPRWRKGLATIGILLYCLAYTALILGALVEAGFLDIEWRGGFGPSLVRGKSGPDYRALATNRARQKAAPASRGALPAAPAPYWTDFRGPRRDGHYDEHPILTNWPPGGPPRLWKQPVGGGYASFVVAEGRAFTIEQRHELEAVTAYDLDTGREVWAHSYPAFFTEWMGGEGPRATPTYHDGRLYSLGATGEFCCLEAATGRLLWRKDILTENQSGNLHYGLATSPLVVDDRVIVLTGQSTSGKSIVAYHRVTGERIWSALDDKLAYVSPMLVRLAGERQLLVVSAKRAMGVKVEDGRLLWEFPWRVDYDNSISAPVVISSNRFLLSAGYGAGCALVEVARSESGFSAQALWRNKNLKNKFNASVCWQGHVYGLDEGVLACLEAQSGQRKWREGRYGYGQLLLAGGHLIVLGGDGELVLLKANPERNEELARVRALKGKTWNVPALAHGRLLVRNSAEMACYDLRLK
jgi:outer membrane protein assembly factor BamB